MLLFTAVIWGAGFVAQRAGMEFVGPLTFGASRYGLRFWFSSLSFKSLERSDRKALLSTGVVPTPKSTATMKKERKTFWPAILCGTVLCGSILQQYGLVFTTAGKGCFYHCVIYLARPHLQSAFASSTEHHELDWRSIRHHRAVFLMHRNRSALHMAILSC